MNDLLLSDKIENGLVKLYKEVAHVKIFMLDYLNMFAVQIRVKNIHLEMKYQSDLIEHNVTTKECYSHNGECVSDHDTLYADKAKLGQVVRNLMSNAIKFTPNNGHIKVFVKFIPTKQSLGKKAENISSTSIFTLNDINQNEQESNQNCADELLVNDPITTRKRRKSITKKMISILALAKISKKANETERMKECSEQIGMLVIEIQDSGAGISSENQKRLFKEIVQFNPEKLQGGGGSGLGLWISKNIVDLHGGRLSVHSEGEGKGSTFRLEIPMTRNNHPAAGIDGKSTSLQSNQNANNISHDETDSNRQATQVIIKKKLLLVDDVGTNRKFLRKLLELRGHECHEAEDGLVALNMVKSSLTHRNTNTSNGTETTELNGNNYDAIFMDFMMPKMNGPDATRAIRELGYTGPIIGVTGNALDEDRSVFMKGDIPAPVPPPKPIPE